MKYLKKFETETDYNTFKASQDYITPNVSLTLDDNEVHYNPYVHDYSQDYLTFEVLEAGTITIKSDTDRSGEIGGATIQYSTDNGNTWTSLTTTSTAQSLGGSLSVGDKVLVKGNGKYIEDNNKGYYKYNDYQFYAEWTSFGGTAKTKIYGNIMSLLEGDNFSTVTTLPQTKYPYYDYDMIFYCAFTYLFKDYTNLISAENLILPTNTEHRCYMGMFDGCTSLEEAPLLSATTLNRKCYEDMFNGCTSLNSITCLATNISPYNEFTSNWVNGVAATGTFTKAAGITSWTTGSNGIPSGWTVVDAT